MASERTSASVTTPPALRITCTSPCSKPRMRAGASRASMQATTATLLAGRTAVFHDGTLAFSHAIPDPDPRPGVRPRFDQIADRVALALRSLGVDARVGEVPGEYCPGSHSVSAGGRAKLMGVGQRLISGGAHVGGVLVVEGADRVRDILLPVYGAMGLDWRPEVTGAVADEVPGVTLGDVIAALREAFGREYELEEAELDEETLELACRLAPEHLSPRDYRASRAGRPHA